MNFSHGIINKFFNIVACELIVTLNCCIYIYKLIYLFDFFKCYLIGKLIKNLQVLLNFRFYCLKICEKEFKYFY